MIQNMPPNRLNDYFNNSHRNEIPIPITVGRSADEEQSFYEAMYLKLFPADVPRSIGYKKSMICTGRYFLQYENEMFKESVDFDQKWSDCSYDYDIGTQLSNKQRIFGEFIEYTKQQEVTKDKEREQKNEDEQLNKVEEEAAQIRRNKEVEKEWHRINNANRQKGVSLKKRRNIISIKHLDDEWEKEDKAAEEKTQKRKNELMEEEQKRKEIEEEEKERKKAEEKEIEDERMKKEEKEDEDKWKKEKDENERKKANEKKKAEEERKKVEEEEQMRRKAIDEQKRKNEAAQIRKDELVEEQKRKDKKRQKELLVARDEEQKRKNEAVEKEEDQAQVRADLEAWHRKKELAVEEEQARKKAEDEQKRKDNMEEEQMRKNVPIIKQQTTISEPSERKQQDNPKWMKVIKKRYPDTTEIKMPPIADTGLTTRDEETETNRKKERRGYNSKANRFLAIRSPINDEQKVEKDTIQTVEKDTKILPCEKSKGVNRIKPLSVQGEYSTVFLSGNGDSVLKIINFSENATPEGFLEEAQSTIRADEKGYGPINVKYGECTEENYGFIVM